MATETIDIVVREKGAATAGRTIAGLGGTARSSSTALDLLRRAALALGGALGVSALAKYSDAFTNMQSRLRLVTDSQTQLAAVQTQLFNIANETRVPVESLVEIYQRMAIGTQDLNVSQAELAAVTTTVAQTVALSGSTTEAANAAIIQFGQGLAAGTLRGEELNSVFEQLSPLARAIAEGMGVGVGQLRALAAEGALTPEVILGALRKMAPEIAAQFAQITPTIGQSITVLRNQFLEFVASFDAVTGTSAGVVEIIQGLGERLPGIAAVGIEAVNVLRAGFQGWFDQVNTGPGIFANLGLSFEGIRAAGSETVAFLTAAFFQFPENIRTVIDIAIVEFQRLFTWYQQYANTFVGTVSTMIQNVSQGAVDTALALIPGGAQLNNLLGEPIKGLDLSGIIDRSIQKNAELDSRRQAEATTAQDFLADSFARRDSALAAAQAREQALDSRASGILQDRGLLQPETGTTAPGAPEIGAPAGPVRSKTVSEDDVRRLIDSGGLRGNDFNRSTVQVQIQAPDGSLSTLQGDPGEVKKLTNGLQSASLKSGRR